LGHVGLLQKDVPDYRASVDLAASVVRDDGTELPLIYPSSSCGLNVPDRCTIGFEAGLPGRSVVTVRLNASGPATVKWMGWHDRMPM
jgi:hypothetical protein